MSEIQTKRIRVIWTPTGIQTIQTLLIDGEEKIAISKPNTGEIEFDLDDFA